ncbi:MAG TPA: metalloregulator ArsR/SmtB family transcription factor [Gemmatimonadales bacterium]|nr:metalloregulator ArsR/SmtB family transcription factor [Gemmatimonadales bacterium]
MPTPVKLQPDSTSDTRIRVARLFQALSDPTRLHIVELLADGEHCVCDLMAAVDAAQSRLSFHLKVLKDAGLVVDRRQGRWVHYRLRPEALEEMAGALQLVREARPGAWRSITCC